MHEAGPILTLQSDCRCPCGLCDLELLQVDVFVFIVSNIDIFQLSLTLYYIILASLIFLFFFKYFKGLIPVSNLGLLLLLLLKRIIYTVSEY